MNETLAERAAEAHERWMNSEPPLGLIKQLFWDCNLATLDAEKHARQIVERVAEYGGLEDWKITRRHYGDEQMKQIVTTARSLSPTNRSVLLRGF